MLWGTAFALAAAAGLVDLPALQPRLLIGPVVGLGLFVVLAGELPRLPSRPTGVLAARAAYLVGAASFEELIWRRIALTLLAHTLGTLAAVGLTSALFALSHYRALGARSATHIATGAGFAAAFLGGGLASAILAHAVYNVLVDLGVQAGRVGRRPA